MSAQPNPDPTPEQIRERCAEIRKEWSEETMLKRARHSAGSSGPVVRSVSLAESTKETE